MRESAICIVRPSRTVCSAIRSLRAWEGNGMPETPEVDTDKLREAVHEELEHAGGSFLRRIALTTAILAAIAAIAALNAGSTANEALVLKTEATQLQAQASDQWAYYQA